MKDPKKSTKKINARILKKEIDLAFKNTNNNQVKIKKIKMANRLAPKEMVFTGVLKNKMEELIEAIKKANNF